MAKARHADGGPSDVLVLAYHAVSDSWPAVTTVTVSQFHEQLESLLARGYKGTTFTQALTSPPPGRVMAITCDDAHRSVYEVAYPLLREHGVPATIFAPTDYVGTGQPTGWQGFEAAAAGPHAHELVCMSWDQLAEVTEDSGWEIGSHTCSHPHLPTLSDERLRDELERSRQTIEERLGGPCPSIAYPYGDHDTRVVAAADAAGYRFGATLPVGGARSLPLRWARVGVFRSDSQRRFKLLTAPGTRRFLATTSGDTVADAVRVAKGVARRVVRRERG
jgi:peptidoglycan/xylan/chitin deacetylase (PgdA/CDA1 family)